MHVFGSKPGRKWPFPDLIRGGQPLLMDPRIISRLQEDTCKHTPHITDLKWRTHPSFQVMLSFQISRWGEISVSASSSAHCRRKCQIFHISLTIICLIYFWSQTFYCMWQCSELSCSPSSHTTRPPPSTLSSTPSKTHMDFCVSPQIFE